MSSEWTKEAHVQRYLGRADTLPHRDEAEAALLDEIPPATQRVLDLGTGDGRLLALVLGRCRVTEGVAVDFSDAMIAQFWQRFADKEVPRLVKHDLSLPLPDLGRFDAVVSSFAIHHLDDLRKRELSEEVFGLLLPGGVFCNLEHVSPATPYRHSQFMDAIGYSEEDEDPSNKLLDVETQLGWLREIGFADVDCLWKWREIALLCGIKPGRE